VEAETSAMDAEKVEYTRRMAESERKSAVKKPGASLSTTVIGKPRNRGTGGEKVENGQPRNVRGRCRMLIISIRFYYPMPAGPML